MDKKIIFVKTGKGDDEFKSKTSHLSGDFKRVLGLVDDSSTVEELKKRAAPSLRKSFEDMLQELENDGFIADKSRAGSVPRMATPKTSQPIDAGDDLDFTSIMPKPVTEDLAAEASKAKAQKAIQEQEIRSQQEAEARARAEVAAQAKAEQDVARVQAELAAAQAKASAEREAL